MIAELFRPDGSSMGVCTIEYATWYCRIHRSYSFNIIAGGLNDDDNVDRRVLCDIAA